VRPDRGRWDRCGSSRNLLCRAQRNCIASVASDKLNSNPSAVFVLTIWLPVTAVLRVWTHSISGNLPKIPLRAVMPFPRTFRFLLRSRSLAVALPFALQERTTHLTSLGEIAMGPFVDADTGLPPLSLRFADTILICPAPFSGSLEQTNLLLADASVDVAPFNDFGQEE